MVSNVHDGQQAFTRRRARFAAALAAVREAAPGLPVLGRTSPEATTDTLRELSAEARALVVPATLPEADAVARSPVLVVPAEGPPRTTWLPSRERGWAFTAR